MSIHRHLPQYSTRRVPPVSLWLFKVRFFGFWFGLSKLKLEHRSSERVLEEKREHGQESRASWTPSISQWSSRIHTALRVHPSAFPSVTWNKQKKKESVLAQTSPALQPLPLAFCQLPMVSGRSIWPRRRWGQTFRFPCFVLSLGTDAGEKKTPMALHLLSGSVYPYLVSKNWWWKSPQALRHEHESELFLREDVLIAYDRAVGDAKVRPVSLTNGKWPALPELTWPWKPMREEWRTSPASIGKARNTTMLAEQHSKAKEKPKAQMRNTHNAADSCLRCPEPRSRAIIVQMVYLKRKKVTKSPERSKLEPEIIRSRIFSLSTWAICEFTIAGGKKSIKPFRTRQPRTTCTSIAALATQRHGAFVSHFSSRRTSQCLASSSSWDKTLISLGLENTGLIISLAILTSAAPQSICRLGK